MQTDRHFRIHYDESLFYARLLCTGSAFDASVICVRLPAEPAHNRPASVLVLVEPVVEEDSAVALRNICTVMILWQTWLRLYCNKEGPSGSGTLIGVESLVTAWLGKWSPI